MAATLPGHVGTPPPEDFSIESCARAAAALAADNHCDVVVGYIMGATVALEMAASGPGCRCGWSRRAGGRRSHRRRAPHARGVSAHQRGHGSGSRFFLPDEEPQRVAGIIAEAVGMA